VAECISRIRLDKTINLNLYTVDEITKMFKLNRITLYNYIKTKNLRLLKLAGLTVYKKQIYQSLFEILNGFSFVTNKIYHVRQSKYTLS
jgi:hypothetical protein